MNIKTTLVILGGLLAASYWVYKPVHPTATSNNIKLIVHHPAS